MSTVINPKRFDIPNLASKLPEPLRRPAGMVMQGLMDMLGGQDDPLMNFSPVPLISIFKNALGVPSRTIRQRGTKAFVDSAKALSHGIGKGAEMFAKRYPRTAAHMEVDPKLVRDPSYTADVYIREPVITKPVNMRFTESGFNTSNYRPDEAHATFAHEGTHVGQKLMNRDTDQLYDGAMFLGSTPDNPRTGYSLIPQEWTARSSEQRARGLGNVSHLSKKALRSLDLGERNRQRRLALSPRKTSGALLEELVQSHLPPLTNRYDQVFKSSKRNVAEWMDRILKDRKSRGWQPK